MIERVIRRHEPGAEFKEVITRTAVRAVIRDGGRLLLIRSGKVGDYKFPGGGLEDGETETEALAREVLEESGHRVVAVGGALLRIEELGPARESPRAAFRMLSTYYACSVGGGAGAQRLDDYERELGFAAAWIEAGRALEANRQLLAAGGGAPPPWLGRETLALETLIAAGLAG